MGRHHRANAGGVHGRGLGRRRSIPRTSPRRSRPGPKRCGTSPPTPSSIACGPPTRDGAATWPGAVPVRDADGAVREWVGVHEDITERHASEVALQGGPGRRRGAQPGQEPLPRQHEPRAADAAVGGDRLLRDAGGGGGGTRPGKPAQGPRQDQVERQAPARADQRRARPRQGRGREDGALSPRTSTSPPSSRTRPAPSRPWSARSATTWCSTSPPTPGHAAPTR